jgi:glycosyltransferase involved in cell wall biosynthesis
VFTKEEFARPEESLSGGVRLEHGASKVIRVLAFVETSWVSGIVKNIIGYARRSANAQSLVRANIELATFHRGSSLAGNELVPACEQAGVKIHVIRERSAFDPGVIPAMRELISTYNPQVVQTHAVKSHFLMRLTGMHRHHPWIAFHHGYTWTDLKARVYNKLDRWSLPAATKVVTVCRPFARSLEKIGVPAERIIVRHNSVNPFVPAAADRVLELRRTLGIAADAQVLVSVGRFSREKGQADLIEAMALLRKQKLDHKLCLVFVGDGPDNQRLRDKARTSQVEDCVVFAGQQPDVTPYYTMADMMVLPSHTEGSPNTLLEAMAVGLPIVATAVGGVPEIVSDGKEALLVEKQNPAALAGAIAQVIGNEALRAQIAAGARNAAPSYSPAAYCDFMLSLYNSCLVDSPKQIPAWWQRLLSARSGGL